MEKAKFNPIIQVASFRHLLKEGYISSLNFKKNWKGKYKWYFNVEPFILLTDDTSFDVELSEYQVKVVYTREKPPKVYITHPVLPKTTKHLYKDGSLCLYKPKNWQWENEMKFHEELFPDICLWLYHYENWRDTGNWFGEEAAHDPSPALISNILYQIKNGNQRYLPLPH